MTDQAREARNAYRRKWYKENTDKVKAQIERYWEKKARTAAEAENPKKTVPAV